MARDLSRLAGLSSVNALTEGAQQGTVLELDPSQVRVAKQVRKKFTNIEELAKSMEEEQQSPIIVSPLDKNTNTYLLQKGERRLRAAKLIPGFKIKAIVDPTVRTKSKSTASQLAENIQREPLTPIEIAEALVDLREQMKEEGGKGTGRELAKYCNKPESWVSKHLALAHLPDELAALIDEGVTTDSELIQSLAKICELQPDLYLKLVNQARSEPGLSRSEAREYLKVARGGTPTDTGPNVLVDDSEGLKPSVQTETSNQSSSTKSGSAAEEGRSFEAREPLSSDRGGNTEPLSSENISHAKTSGQGEGGSEGQNASSQAHVGKTDSLPKPPAKKLGKTEVIEIAAAEMVMQVRVSTDKNQFTGELLLNMVCGNRSKGMVSYLEGGKQHKALFDLDAIEIISLAQLAQGD